MYLIEYQELSTVSGGFLGSSFTLGILNGIGARQSEWAILWPCLALDAGFYTWLCGDDWLSGIAIKYSLAPISVHAGCVIGALGLSVLQYQAGNYLGQRQTIQ